VTGLRFAAPATAVRAALLEPEGWLPGWADAVDVRRSVRGGREGLGRRFDATVRAPAGYRLTARIEVVEAGPDRLRMRATGDLEGEGRWQLRADPDGTTAATLDWDVVARVAWLAALTPLARPLFVRSHHAVVHHAAEAVAAHLDGALLRCTSRAVPVRR
jgi:hypothetical protein